MQSITGEYVVKDNYHDIYLHNIEKHMKDYTFSNQPRGFKQQERLFTAFTLLNPVDRICYHEVRRINIVFLFAEVLWYLKGDNSLDFIAYYCPAMKKFSADQKTLQGSAYGTKIFNWQGHLNQWQCICDELKKDPDSKRAVIHIRDPIEMMYRNNIDATCTLTLQFLIREGRLIMITSMRANDMYRGAVSDVFSFTFIHELMSRQLGLEPGSYHHQVGSTHIYEPDYEKAKALLASKKERQHYSFMFPLMPEGDNWKHIDRVLEYEEQLRHNRLSLDMREINLCGLPEYWLQVVLLFDIYREITFERKINGEKYGLLNPLYRYLMGNRHDESELHRG